MNLLDCGTNVKVQDYLNPHSRHFYTAINKQREWPKKYNSYLSYSWKCFCKYQNFYRYYKKWPFTTQKMKFSIILCMILIYLEYFLHTFTSICRAGEMDFTEKWNTEKCCRPPWLADKKNFWIANALKWLKQ